jgi:hypothetical protein
MRFPRPVATRSYLSDSGEPGHALTWEVIPPGVQISKFPNDLDPFALYNFEGNLLDTSGNGRDLTAGASNYIDIFPGFVGREINSGAPATRNDQAFNLPGDITILSMIQANDYVGANVLAFRGIGGTQALNYIYSFGPYAGTRQLQFFSETGIGVGTTFNGTLRQLPFIHNLVWLGMTRIGGVVQYWINGRKNGVPSGVIATPNGGTSSVLITGEVGEGAIGAIKFWDRGLSDAEMAQQYNVTMGRVFGEV